MSLFELGLASLVVGLGAAVQGSVGFGLALVSVPMLILIDPRLVPGPMLCAGILLTLLMSLRERRGIDFGEVGWALVGRFPGTALGAAALIVLPRNRLTLVFAVLVLVAVGLTALPWKIRPGRASLVAAGGFSGFMATTVAMGGPPMALLFQHSPGARLRGTLSGFFVVGASVSLLALVAIGHFGREELRLGLGLLPGVVAGFLVSGRVARTLDRGRTRTAVLSAAAMAGAVALIRSLV